jgi:transposase
MFSYVDLESRIPQTHPIRKVRQVVDAALSEIEGQFDEMYAAGGRPSTPPEMLIRASLLQILSTIRSERQLCERIDHDLMFRWFVGLGMDDPVWNHSSFSENRDRLMASQVDELLFEAVKKQAYAMKLLSRDHFTVHGTLLEASASLKSFKPKDRRDDDPPSGGSKASPQCGDLGAAAQARVQYRHRDLRPLRWASKGHCLYRGTGCHTR